MIQSSGHESRIGQGDLLQVAWIYGSAKDTQAMVDLIEVLFNQQFRKSRIFVTWDAASWHSSNELIAWLDDFNAGTRRVGAGPIIELVPLPKSSQFLDVIEAVFSGRKRAVIHHSDYKSGEDMKLAISRHLSTGMSTSRSILGAWERRSGRSSFSRTSSTFGRVTTGNGSPKEHLPDRHNLHPGEGYPVDCGGHNM